MQNQTELAKKTSGLIYLPASACKSFGSGQQVTLRQGGIKDIVRACGTQTRLLKTGMYLRLFVDYQMRIHLHPDFALQRCARLANHSRMASISARRLKKELLEIRGSEGCPAGWCAYSPLVLAFMPHRNQAAECGRF